MSSNLEEQILSDLMEELEKDDLVLPTLPEVALKIRDTVDDENASVKDVAKVVSSDTALTAKIIQIANSPILRANKKIESVDFAISRMGNKMLRNIVNSIIVKQMFQATSDATDKRFRSLWEHSTQVASISYALAAFARLKPDEAMLAGLVHDVGALPILKLAEDIPELRKNEAMLDSIINKLHTTVGTAILKKWEFPPELVNVVAEHENLQYNPDQPTDYVDVVIAANLQSYMGTDHPMATVNWSEVPAFAKLGLDTEVAVIDMGDVGEDVKEIQSVLI
jgi:putative nucleotidyltransferase with HDIG domain